MDKQHEKKILKMVYEESLYTIINDSEKPDFILKTKDNIFFGVEVTERFNSQSSARLIKNESYLGKLLDESLPDSKRYMDRRDKRVFTTDTISFFDNAGKPKFESKAVMQTNLTRDEYLENLVNLIKEKDEKFKNYNPELSHVNLLIFDAVHGQDCTSADNFYEYIFTNSNGSLLTVLQESLFNEITIIVNFSDYYNFINLKELIMTSRVIFFFDFYKSESCKQNLLNYLTHFFYCLIAEGFKNIRCFGDGISDGIIYAGVDFEILKENRFSLSVKRNNNSISAGTAQIEDLINFLNPQISKKFYEKYKRYISDKTLVIKTPDICFKSQ